MSDDLSTRGIARQRRSMTNESEKERLAQALREGDTAMFIEAVRAANKPTPTEPETPQTAAGRALYNLVREPLVYGVTDRMNLRSGYESAWAIRDGILAIEAEARAVAWDVLNGTYDRGFDDGRAARDAEVRAVADALSMKAAIDRQGSVAEQHIAMGIDIAVHELRAILLSDTPEMGS